MSTPNPRPEGAPNVEPDSKSSGSARKASRPPLCWKYQSISGCPDGDRCRFAHIDPKPGKRLAASSLQRGTPPTATEVTTASISGASGELQVKNKSNWKPKKNWEGEGKGQLAPEAVREQGLSQPTAAKSANAKKITIFSEDEERTWTLERGFLSKHSQLLGSVLSYSGKEADAGVRDPLKSLSGFIRVGDGSGSLQLHGVKAVDFDVFLEGLRATTEIELNEEELKVFLALASDWGFDDLRNRTIHTIEQLHFSPIDRAVLARRCKISKWIREALLSLAIGPDPLNAKEIQVLGATTAAVVWRAREAIFTRRQHILTTIDHSKWQVKCHAVSCKHALHTTLLRVLEKPGSAGESGPDVITLLKKEISADEKKGLCRNCASYAGLRSMARDVAEEFQVAKAVLEDTFGNEDTVWLEPA
ncbi:hypothetical protein FRC00_002848 [Tulasnella sp. 408]|nr:hypothetical protein FRC00_002848 [Tulasnella sp. 408]